MEQKQKAERGKEIENERSKLLSCDWWLWCLWAQNGLEREGMLYPTKC